MCLSGHNLSGWSRNTCSLKLSRFRTSFGDVFVLYYFVRVSLCISQLISISVDEYVLPRRCLAHIAHIRMNSHRGRAPNVLLSTLILLQFWTETSDDKFEPNCFPLN